VLANPEARELIDKVEAVLAFSLPLYEREGKSYLTVGIGCTGGRHRSVVARRGPRRAGRKKTGSAHHLFCTATPEEHDILSDGSTPAASVARARRDSGGHEVSSDETATAKFTIVNARGLHARAATKLVQLAGKYPCEVTVSGPDGEAANAKSVMGVLLLCGSRGTVIEVRPAAREASRGRRGHRQAHRRSLRGARVMEDPRGLTLRDAARHRRLARRGHRRRPS
jgi:phosphocarrier protein HPr